MTNELTTRPQTAMTKQIDSAAIEKVLIDGNLGALSVQDRVTYYGKVCESLGLNPLTQPFAYLTFQGKTVLYATRACTEQLRKIYGVSVVELKGEQIGDLYITTCKLQDTTGRTDASTGAVNTAGLKGEALANAIMKSETKSKRRGTLSICGLAMLDESELDGIQDAKRHQHEPSSQEAKQARPQQQSPPPRQEAAKPAQEKPAFNNILKMRPDQWEAIKSKAKEAGCSQTRILAYYGVSRPNDLIETIYGDCVSKIANKFPDFMPAKSSAPASNGGGNPVEALYAIISEMDLADADLIDAAAAVGVMNVPKKLEEMSDGNARLLLAKLQSIARV